MHHGNGNISVLLVSPFRLHVIGGQRPAPLGSQQTPNYWPHADGIYLLSEYVIWIQDKDQA